MWHYDSVIRYLRPDGKRWEAALHGATFLHRSEDGNAQEPSSEIRYQTWDRTAWVSTWDGSNFTHSSAASGQHQDRTLSYKTWDDTDWSAHIEGERFYHVRNGSGEVDFSRRGESEVLWIDPPNEYLIYFSAQVGLDVHWRVWADRPFDLIRRGLRLPEAWQHANPGFGGTAGFGLQGQDGGFTFYLVVRAAEPTRLQRTGNFLLNGSIQFPFPNG